MTNSTLYRRLILGLVGLTILALITFFVSSLEIKKPISEEAFRLQLENQDYLKQVAHVEWHSADHIPDYLKSNIEKAYARGWKLLDRSITSGTKAGLQDYFTKDFLALFESDSRTESTEYFSRTHITHNIIPIKISADQSWVLLEDSSSLVYINGSPELRIDHYKVVMYLQDGRWRIDEIRQTSSEYIKKVNTGKNNLIPNINGVNYYPYDRPWLEFWSNYDEDAIKKDFEIIQSSGFNSIRIFIPYLEDISEEFRNDLSHLMKTAEESKLKVIVTLFDFPKHYSPENYGQHFTYINILYRICSKHESLLIWDIKNEPDLDFEKYGKRVVLNWLDVMCSSINLLDNKTPVTIGWSKASFADLKSEIVDLISFHHYDDPQILDKDLLSLGAISNKKVFVSEYGLPTFSWPIVGGGNDEEDQMTYLNQVQSILKKHNAGGAIWCYSDFSSAPKYVFGWKPWVRHVQTKYGVVDTLGRPKLFLKQ